MTAPSTATVTLPTDEQIVIRREFDAPRHLVYRAWTSPELVKRWWSGHRGEVTLAEIDLRVGGTWRYVLLAGGSFEVAFHGEFREIVPDERIVYTGVFEAVPTGETVNTVTFEEGQGGTALTLLVQTDSRATRDAIISSGMEGGMQEQMAALDQVAISLALA